MASFKSTRERILHCLMAHPRSTINELAGELGINAISVRHHLQNLQAEALVAAEEERHGVGRPRLVYYLTEAGLEKFPTRYFRLTNRLIERMKETLPSTMVAQIFTEMADSILSNYEEELTGLSPEERLELVKTLLEDEGYSVDWEEKDGKVTIRGIICPYYQIGQAHPEVCSVDQTLISRILGIAPENIQRVADGEYHCRYEISKEKLEELNK